jgi:hypothetical protein
MPRRARRTGASGTLTPIAPAAAFSYASDSRATVRNGLRPQYRPAAANRAIGRRVKFIVDDGEDLRREPIETRKSTLKSLLRGKHAGIATPAS